MAKFPVTVGDEQTYAVSSAEKSVSCQRRLPCYKASALRKQERSEALIASSPSEKASRTPTIASRRGTLHKMANVETWNCRAGGRATDSS